MAIRTIITPVFRVSFPDVFIARAFENKEPRFGLTMLFDKSADLSELKKLAAEVAREKWADKLPNPLRSPFRDGDEKGLDGYAGTIYVRAISKIKPGLIDQAKKKIVDPEDFYAGCYARAQVHAFWYDNSGNKGVSFSVDNIQKVRDGEKFSGREDAESVFDAIEPDGGGEDVFR